MLLESTINGLVAVLFLSSVKAEFTSTYTCKRMVFVRGPFFFSILSLILVKKVNTAVTYLLYFFVKVCLSYTYFHGG